MTEILVTFAAEQVLRRVVSLAEQRFNFLWGFKGEVAELRRSLSKIQAMLLDAQQCSQVRGKRVEIWLKDLEGIAHHADDVLDEYQYVLRRKVQLQGRMKNKVVNFFSHSNPIIFRHKMVHEIKNINASLLNLNNEAASIGLVARPIDTTSTSHDHRETVSTFHQDEKSIVGREELLSELVTALINSSSHNRENNYLSSMAIVGVGGLGKTTLAKSIYHASHIDQHFNKKIWICVSTDFDVKMILSKILEHLRPEIPQKQSKDAILTNLQEALEGKRYLLVLDDVWNEDSERWNDLMSCLLSFKGTQGSSIIVTTRKINVASIMQPFYRCDLGKLSVDECWVILKERVLNNSNVPS